MCRYRIRCHCRCDGQGRNDLCWTELCSTDLRRGRTRCCYGHGGCYGQGGCWGHGVECDRIAVRPGISAPEQVTAEARDEAERNHERPLHGQLHAVACDA